MSKFLIIKADIKNEIIRNKIKKDLFLKSDFIHFKVDLGTVITAYI